MKDILEKLGETLESRGGADRYAEVCSNSQQIKEVIGFPCGQHTANEALHMIAHKIGRICQSGGYCQDDWRDIAGYAIRQLEVLVDADNAVIIPAPQKVKKKATAPKKAEKTQPTDTTSSDHPDIVKIREFLEAQKALGFSIPQTANQIGIDVKHLYSLTTYNLKTGKYPKRGDVKEAADTFIAVITSTSPSVPTQQEEKQPKKMMTDPSIRDGFVVVYNTATVLAEIKKAGVKTTATKNAVQLSAVQGLLKKVETKEAFRRGSTLYRIAKNAGAEFIYSLEDEQD